MTLQEDFHQSGTWLFRHRSYVPLVLLPLTAIVIFFSDDFPQPFAEGLWWKLLSLGVALGGMVIRAIVVGKTPSGTSGRNTGGQIAEALNTTGIYSVVRHPLYVGNFVTVFGIVLWTGIWWFVLFASVLYWFYYERIMYVEEEYLISRYGQAFRDWAARTPAVIPSFEHYEPSALRFSLKNVLAREYDGFLAIATAFCILEVLEYVNSPQDNQLDAIWFAIFGGAFVAAAILRYARKHTQLLAVTDR
jgi:protein-S-isoprenylcysteine O-methyltransferase Ste14